ncbi:hypothetical protein [Streptomyces sp. NRRL F-5135]|uniref:hypothetical protein n=1 Tax=Streptomyces sp. NRRL F-5135 TaxID=1463858 RepID=UPI0004CA937B|nr:hypothetical protein [Streptomyces sp. NRRL F-5135]
MSKREILRRLEALEALLNQPPARIAGQTALPMGMIGHHTYEGPGACRADLFGTVCGAHRDAHEFVDDGR